MTWCAMTEAALVHLQQHKFKHFGGMPAFDARGVHRPRQGHAEGRGERCARDDELVSVGG